MNNQNLPNHQISKTELFLGGFMSVVLVTAFALILWGCSRRVMNPHPITALTNTAPCYSGYCDTNCPYRNNTNYIGCGPNGTGPYCPGGGGVCRGIILDKYHLDKYH